MTRAQLTIVTILSALCLASGCKKDGPTESFAGRYRSTWGDTVFSQVGARVTATYPNGTLDCVASGKTLDCAWKEPGMVGRARLVKQPNDSLDGTWGNREDAERGGRWLFNPLDRVIPAPK